MGSASIESGGVTATSKVMDVLLPLPARGKTVMLCLMILVLLTLHTLLNALVCCLQFNTERGVDAIWKVD